MILSQRIRCSKGFVKPLPDRPRHLLGGHGDGGTSPPERKTFPSSIAYEKTTATTAWFELLPAHKRFAAGAGHPSAGDVPPSPCSAQGVVDGLGTSLQTPMGRE